MKKKKNNKIANKTIEILQNQAQNSVTVNCIEIYTGAIKNESEYCHQTRLKYDLSERGREPATQQLTQRDGHEIMKEIRRECHSHNAQKWRR